MGTFKAAQFSLGSNHVLRRIEGLKGGKTLLERWLQIGEEHKGKFSHERTYFIAINIQRR